MPRDRVRDFVTEHRGEPGVVARHRQDPGVDGDLAAGQRERVHLLVLDDVELPLVVGASGRIGDAPADARHRRVQRGIFRDRRFLDDLLVGVEPHRELGALGKQDELAAAGDGNGLASKESDEQHRDERNMRHVHGGIVQRVTKT